MAGYKGSRPFARHRAAGGAAQSRRLRPRRPRFRGAAPAASSMSGSSWSRSMSRVSSPPDLFKAEVDRHIRDLNASRRLPGVEEIRVPGQGSVGAPPRARDATACRSARRWWRRSTRSRDRSASRRSARALSATDGRRAICRRSGASRCASIASRGRRRLHRAAGGGRRRRQSPVVPALAGDARARIVADRGRGARAPRRRRGAT